jgi:hypothetical protein
MIKKRAFSFKNAACPGQISQEVSSSIENLRNFYVGFLSHTVSLASKIRGGQEFCPNLSYLLLIPNHCAKRYALLNLQHLLPLDHIPFDWFCTASNNCNIFLLTFANNAGATAS